MNVLSNNPDETIESNTINTLYKEYYNYLVFVGLKQGVELDIVKDIINQTFLAFLEKQINFKEIKNVKSFVITSFKRKLIDNYREDVKKYNYLNQNLFQNEIDPSIEDRILHNQSWVELKNKLEKAFQQLPPRCQTAIFLKYYEGLNNEQIVERTGLTTRSVYNNLFEGIKKMREIMENENIDSKFLPDLLLFMFI
ncbi:RNA polymerase sigma factor [Solitalea longa]|nr:sigma-70 family RNA polymerase sigma factor [Solitalea longa]